MPATDAEAVERILAVAKSVVDERGSAMRVVDVARELGVTRQTAYHSFRGAQVATSCRDFGGRPIPRKSRRASPRYQQPS